MGILGYGYTGDDGQKVSALRDMFDGGGGGRYGDTFQGGPYSGVLNVLGVRPMGYRDRQERNGQTSPQPRPSQASASPAAPAGQVMSRSDWASMPSAPNYPNMGPAAPQTPLEAYLAGMATRGAVAPQGLLSIPFDRLNALAARDMLYNGGGTADMATWLRQSGYAPQHYYYPPGAR